MNHVRKCIGEVVSSARASWYDDLVAPELYDDDDDECRAAEDSSRVRALSDAVTIINDDAGNMTRYGRHCSGCDTVVFDHSFEDRRLLEMLPSPNAAFDKLLLFSDTVHFDSVAVAVNRGWRPAFEFVWDLRQCWLVPGRPLTQHKTCRVFCGTDVEFQDAFIKRGNNDGHLSSIYRCSNTAYKSKTDGIQYEKPIEWVAAILKSINAKKVLDMFAGGGGVLMSCLRGGIPYCGFEIDPERCGMMERRYDKFIASRKNHEDNPKGH